MNNSHLYPTIITPYGEVVALATITRIHTKASALDTAILGERKGEAETCIALINSTDDDKIYSSITYWQERVNKAKQEAIELELKLAAAQAQNKDLRVLACSVRAFVEYHGPTPRNRIVELLSESE